MSMKASNARSNTCSDADVVCHCCCCCESMDATLTCKHCWGNLDVWSDVMTWLYWGCWAIGNTKWFFRGLEVELAAAPAAFWWKRGICHFMCCVSLVIKVEWRSALYALSSRTCTVQLLNSEMIYLFSPVITNSASFPTTTLPDLFDLWMSQLKG